jgi:hypothetical protein
MENSQGKLEPWVEVVENPGTSYNWALLAEKQSQLVAYLYGYEQSAPREVVVPAVGSLVV